MSKQHVQRNDMVEVITGEYVGVQGRVLRTIPKEDRVVVEGVNVVTKHVKPTRENPRGGRTEREAPIHASNVMLVCQNGDCEKYDDPVRTRTKVNADGSKDRVCVKCGHTIVPQE
ncbi:MAG: 50S ribosomal protein L24 [Planctomycetota bacterium]